MTFITEKRDTLSRGWFVIFGAVVVVMIVGVVLAARGALDPPIPSPAPEAVAAALRRGGRRAPTTDQLFRWFREWAAGGVFRSVTLR